MSAIAFSEQDLTPHLGRIAAALGPAAGLAYSPPHDYPMSVPFFDNTPCIERTRPEFDKLRLYAHIPFCNYGCTYCFFAKRIGAGSDQMERYVKALKRELEWVEPGTPLSQLFVGGGTPTALSPELLNEVLTAIFSRMSCNNSEVHTVETSPESITEEHIRVLRDHNIGRISMGIQSLDENVLDTVNRRHSAEEALAACELLVDAGFILNIDLIYGLPGQSHESFRRDLEIVTSRNIHAVTLYDLRVNERTPVTKAIEDEERWNLSRLVNWRAFVKNAAEELGFTQTRWHTFKRLDSIASRHERAPCFTDDGLGYQLGIGMSARSQLGYTVYRNNPHFNAYLERIETGNSPVEDTILLNEGDRKTQFVARSLGDGKPLDRTAYETAFGSSIDDDFGGAIERLRDNGVVDDDTHRLYLTEIGKLVYDLVTVSFYPDHAFDWLHDREQSARTRGRLPISVD